MAQGWWRTPHAAPAGQRRQCLMHARQGPQLSFEPGRDPILDPVFEIGWQRATERGLDHLETIDKRDADQIGVVVVERPLGQPDLVTKHEADFARGFRYRSACRRNRK